jgi:hypothetical protein
MLTRRDFAKLALWAAATAPLLKGRALHAQGSPPFDFSTFPSTSQFKLLGGSMLQVPPGDGWPYSPPPPTSNPNYQYTWLWQNWVDTYPNWIYPQMVNWALRGCNHIRMMWCADGIVFGTMDQTAANTQAAQFIDDAAALGMYTEVSCNVAIPSTYPGSFTASQWFAPVQSLITNVLASRIGLISCMEAGMQESNVTNTSPPMTMNNTLASMAAGAISTPQLISSTNYTGFAGYSTSVQVYGIHTYPNYAGGSPTTYEQLRSILYTILNSNGAPNIPILFEEGNVNLLPGYFGFTYTIQDMADFFNNWFEGAWGHPLVVGVQPWSGFGPSSDGTWSDYVAPSNIFDPTATWGDTVASNAYRSWGKTNRNLSFNLSLNSSQTISGTAAAISMNATRNSVSNPSVTNVNFGSRYPINTNVIANLLLTLTGDSGSQYTFTLGAVDFNTSVFHALGTPVVVTGGATNLPLVTQGQLPYTGTWVPQVQMQRTSGSVNGTITALSGNLQIGVAPAIASLAGGGLGRLLR